MALAYQISLVPMKKSILKSVKFFGFLYIVLAIVGGVALAVFSLRLPRHHIQEAQRNIVLAQVSGLHAWLEDVNISAADGTVLRGWYVVPEHSNGAAVILLHGVTDNRLGMAGYGEFLLQHGYSILLPDARRHGESGGDLATYGLNEAKDVHGWIDWLYRVHSPSCLYGLGESMGAAIVLQFLKYESRFCAVVAESSFSDFRQAALDRVSVRIGLPPVFGKYYFRLPVEIALLYTHLRYGLDLNNASPQDAVPTAKHQSC